jgi:hypothetical protein
MVFLLLRFRQHIDSIRDKSEESPYAFMWITLALSTLAIPMGYFHSYASNTKHISALVLMATTWVLSLVGILYLGGMLSWGLHRQAQKKSWGVRLPDEAHVWLFRPGVWVGLAIGMLYQSIFLVFGAVLWILSHLQIGLTIVSVSGVVGIVYTVQSANFFYQIPKRAYLWRFIALPLLMVSVLGIILAVVFGQIHNYEQAAKRHAKLSSTVILPTNPPIMATVPNARMTPTLATSIGHPASTHSLSKTFPAQGSVTAAPRMFPPMSAKSFTTIDQHCIGGLPMRLPQQSEWHHPGTVKGIVPRLEAVSAMFKTQNTVHGFLDPEYLADQRVVVHPSGAGPNARLIAVVPSDMTVQVGQKVEMAGAHLSHHYACRYAPNLLMHQTNSSADTARDSEDFHEAQSLR